MLRWSPAGIAFSALSKLFRTETPQPLHLLSPGGGWQHEQRLWGKVMESLMVPGVEGWVPMGYIPQSMVLGLLEP
jgi:hypothetical protein